jgi:hypothetical protein
MTSKEIECLNLLDDFRSRFEFGTIDVLIFDDHSKTSGGSLR